jgi:hypothetical protein
VYENAGGTLSLAWSSAEFEQTRSVAWGDWDGDGDLDLAVGNYGQPNWVYANTGGALVSAWTSAESDWTVSVAWGDWDGDGDLDLAAGNLSLENRVYANGWLNRPGKLPETPTSPVLASRSGTTAAAFGYSSAEVLDPPVAIPFTLLDDQSDPAWRIVPGEVTGTRITRMLIRRPTARLWSCRIGLPQPDPRDARTWHLSSFDDAEHLDVSEGEGCGGAVVFGGISTDSRRQETPLESRLHRPAPVYVTQMAETSTARGRMIGGIAMVSGRVEGSMTAWE